ncbi:MAG: DUF2017 domain-containing protein [Candidatus Nanopelagicaceae bacterium]
MSSKFIRAEDGSIHIVFTSQESHVLINLTEQILELLGEGGISTEIDLDPLFQMLGMGGSEQPPEDPVLRRLLPSAYKDEKSASEFRRYTEHGLREKKRAHALAVYEALIPQDEDWDADQPIDRSLIEIRFEESVAMDWLGALNDLRLALAVRLGISKEFADNPAKGENERVQNSTQDETSQLQKKYELMAESDPMKAVYAVYSWLGWLQQSLLELLMTGGDEHQPT